MVKNRIHLIRTIVTGVAIVAVELVVAYAHVGAHETVPEFDVTNAALEALHVIEESKALNYHGRASSYEK